MNQSVAPSLRRKTPLAFEVLEARVLFDGAPDEPVADVQVNVVEEKFINEDVTFAVTFDNTGATEGYAPYVDFIAPAALQIQSASTFGAGATNPAGSAVTPIGRIASDGQLVDVTTGVPVDHPMYAGSSDGGTYGKAGSGTPPVLYDVAGNPNLVGMRVYSAQLPFGSYTPGNPAATVYFTGSLDKANGIIPHQEVVTYASGGFAYGSDALHNPVTDVPVSSAIASAGVTPLVIDLLRTAVVPEEDGLYTGENVSGPNHPITYRLTVNLAEGEEVTNLVIRDLLPDDLAYTGNLTVTFGSGTSGSRNYVVQAEPELNTDGLTAVDPSQDELRIVVDRIIGQGGGDIVVTYTTFVPYREASDKLVVDAVSGEEGDLDPDEYNDASVSATYDPDGAGPVLPYLIGDNEGPMHPDTPFRSFNSDTDYRIEEHSLAIQKRVDFAPGGDRAASGVSQGDVLEYRMNFQISDYFAFDQVVIDDVLGDGQEFLPGDGREGFDVDLLESRPQLTFTMHGTTITLSFDSENFSATENSNGTTSIRLHVYQQLVDSGFISSGDPLLGGLVETTGTAPSALGPGNFNGGATTGIVTFRAKVRDAYENDFITDPRINQGDVLRNTVSITGRNLDIETFAPLANVTDGSAASVTVPVGRVTKELHSVTHAGTIIPASGLDEVRQVVPGDVVTWRLTYVLPISEFETLTVTDFLPLPIFDVNLMDSTQIYAWNASTYNLAGRISFGPGDTFFGAGGASVTGDGGLNDSPEYLAPGTPAITLNPAHNSFTIHFGDYIIPPDAAPVATTIELYVSTIIVDGLYADGLLFTNQVEVQEQNSNVVTVATDQIAQIDITVPDLQITKGVVAASSPHSGSFTGFTGPSGVSFLTPGSASTFSGTVTSSNLAARPMDANVTGLDAGDVVTFAITLENIGNGTLGAFDVRVRDSLPAGFLAPGELGAVPLNLRVTDGTGAALSYTILGGGTDADFFLSGLELTDPSPTQGSLGRFDALSGRNVVIIAYDLVLADAVEAASSQTNIASLENYSYREGGTDYSTPLDFDSATVDVQRPAIAKRVVDTNHDALANVDTAGGGGMNQVAVGEVVTYEVTLTVPEGQLTNLRFRDTLETGLAFLALDSVTASSALSSSLGAWSSVVGIISGGSAGAADEGTLLELGFGTAIGLGNVTNSNRDNTVSETITIRYRAVVTNVNTSGRGDLLDNTAMMTWQVGGEDQSHSSLDSVTIVEPQIRLIKDASSSSVQGDNVISYTILVSNLNGANVSEAYDLVLEDLLPNGVAYAGGLTHAGGVAPDSGSLLFDATAGTDGAIRAVFSTLRPGESSTIRFDVRVDNGLNVGTLVRNTGTVTYTSLPGMPASSTTHNGFGVERTGNPSGVGGVANDYLATDPADLTVTSPVLVSKVVVDTSEDHTSADASSLGTVRAAIGEVVRYSITFQVPQANNPSVQLVDTLDSRLFWLDPSVNNVQIRFDGFDPSGSTFGVAGDLAGGNGTTITLGSSRIAFDSVTNRITFNLGDILNTELDASAAETVTISYNAVIRNSAPVDRSDVLVNSAQLRVNGANVGTPLTASVTVVEPVLSLSKSDNGVTTADAGDLINYRLRVTASSGRNTATAFDLALADAVPEGLEIVTGSLLFSGLPSYVAGASVTYTGQNITAVVNELRPGDSFDVLFQVRVRDTGPYQLQAGERIQNTAQLTFSSLPGDGTDNGVSGNTTGSVSGTPGSASGERNYTLSQSDFFDAPVPVFRKVLGNSSQTHYTIGETVEYVMTVSVPEGRTGGPKAYVFDTVDAGFSFVAGSLSVSVGSGMTVGVAGPLTESNSSFFTRVDGGINGNESLRFDFDYLDYQNGSAGDGLAAQTIEIRYRLSVDNILINQATQTRNNVAQFYYTDDDGATLNLASDASGDTDTRITLVEPVVSVGKQITSIAAHPDAGDTVFYQVAIQHVGTAIPYNVAAYDITVQDALPANLELNPATFTAILNSTIDVSSWFTVTASGLQAVPGVIDLSPGDQILITYGATITTAVRDGDSFLNEVDIEWSTLDGTVAGERSGDGDLANLAAPSNPNDYEAAATASFVADLTPVYGVVKEVVGTSAVQTGVGSGVSATLTDLTIGEVVTYRVTATLGRGTTESVRLVDALSIGNGRLHIQNVSYTAGAALRLASGSAISEIVPVFSDATGADGYIDRVELNFGTIINDPSLYVAAQDEQITLTIEALVVNDIANQQGDVIRNTGTLYFRDATGDQSLDGFVDVEIVEPQLAVTKTVTSVPSKPEAGDVISYQIEVRNDGGANAFDASFSDVVPAGMVLLPASFSAVRASDSADVSSWFTVTTAGITAAGPFDLSAGDSITLSYSTQILTQVTDGRRLTKESSVIWTSLSGSNSGERTGDGSGPNDYLAGDDDTVVIDFQPTITKSVQTTSASHTGSGQGDGSLTDLGIGEAVTYELVAQLGRGTTHGVIVEDILELSQGVLNIRAVRVEAGAALTVGSPVISYLDSNLDGFIDQVRLDFGSVINDHSLSTGAGDEQIRVYIEAEVRNVLANQAGDVINNTGRLILLEDTNGDGVAAETVTRTSTVAVEIVEPEVTAAKTVASVPVNPDAGDAVRYQVVLQNTGGSTAFDISLRDVAPSGLVLAPGTFVAILNGTTDVSSWFTAATTGITAAVPFQLSVNDRVIITYDATIQSSVRDGQRLVNSVAVEWTSLSAADVTDGSDGSDTLERGGDGNLTITSGPSSPNDYEAGAEATVNADLTPLYAFTKLIQSTSEGHTLGSQLVVGETVTYELVAQLGRGTTAGVVIEDILALSSGILDIRDVRVELGRALDVTIPSAVLSDSNADGFQDQVRLDFGTVINNPALSGSATDEQIRIYIDAVVVNVLANQGGDVIANTARLTVLEDTDGDGDADDAVTRDSSVNVTLVEPVVTVNKTIPMGITEVDAGDTVGYRLVIANTSLIDGFDLSLRDVLPAEMSLLSSTFTATRTSDGADVSFLFTVTNSGVTRSGRGFNLAAGDSVVIAYNATVLPTATDGLILNSQAGIEWTTINGANADERLGDGNFDATVSPSDPNDQEDRSAVAIATEISPLYGFTKSVFSTSADHTAGSQLVVGERVTYELVVQIGRGTTAGVVIEDILSLSHGILDIREVRVELGEAITATIPDLTSVQHDSNSDGYLDQVRLEFGTVINNPSLSGSAADEQIRIYIDAVVVNVLVNQEGDVITNTGRLTLLEDTDGDGDADDVVIREASVNVELVEPTLTLGKVVTSQPASPDAGDVVAYEVVITNTSGVDGFDVRFRDLLSPNVALQALSFVAVRSSDGTDVSSFFALTANGLGSDAITQAGSGFALAAGDTITLRYHVVICASILDGGWETNRAGIEWTSISGANTDERGGDGDYDQLAASGNPNDYEASAETAFMANLTGYAFEKSIHSTSHAHTGTGAHDPSITDLTVGETVTYELRGTFAEGTTTGVVFTDIFDVSQGIVQPVSVAVSGGNNLTYTLDPSAISLIDDDGDGYFERVVIDLGTVVNDGGDAINPEADQLVVLIHAQVVNVLPNRSGDQIINRATMLYLEDTNDDGNIDGSDLPSELKGSAVIELVEPVVTVVKEVDDSKPKLGQVLTYTLTITNAGDSTADAFDVEVLDRLAEGLLLDLSSIQIIHLGSPSNPAVIAVDDSISQQLHLLLDRLDQGDSVQIIYRAAVTSDTSFHAAVLPNEVGIEWTSLPGEVAGERGGDRDPDIVADPLSVVNFYEHGDGRSVEVFQPDLAVNKDDAGATVLPGQPITYTMTVTNQGRATALGISLVDDIGKYLDQGFRFVDASDGGVRSGDIVTWSRPDLAIGESWVVTLTLRAPVVLPAGVERVTNTAFVTHQDFDPTPDDNQDDETSLVLAWPDLTVSKDDFLAEATVGDLVTYTITFDNIGNQAASGVVISDSLPPGVEFVSATGGGRYHNGRVTWNLAELPPHGGGSYQVTVRVTSAGIKVNNVIIHDDGLGGLDPTPGNNNDSDETLAEIGLRFDLNQNFLFLGGNLQPPGFGVDGWRDQLARLYPENAAIRDSQVPLVLATHMNSGLAQPGSTITLEVYTARGERIAEQSVIADAGGNWLATFNAHQIHEAPSRIVMRQTWASPNPMMQQGYNYRTYFAPAFSTATYYTEELTVWNVTEKRAATEVLDLYESCECVLQMDWNHATYEFHARGALQSSSGN